MFYFENGIRVVFLKKQKSDRMKKLLLVFILLFETIVFAKIPTTYFDLQKELDNPDFVFLTYDSETTNETNQLLGLKSVSAPLNGQNNSQTTLYKRAIDKDPQLYWSALKLDGNRNFDTKVKGLFVNERNSEEISVWVEEGIYFSDNGGNTFSFLEDETLRSENDFTKKAKELENSSPKYTNQINDLPPMAPTIWDTILWDSSQVLLTNNIPSGAFMHGRVTADDSGYVHVVTLSEDQLLRYFRSTDFGETFEPFVVLDDTIGGTREIHNTGDYVYIYAIESTDHPNPLMQLYVSPDKGLTWNFYEYPFAAQSAFMAVLDSAYDFQEWGAGGPILQAKSFDAGNTFSSYVPIADTIYSAYQPPQVAVGNNTILYVRHGNDWTANAVFVYRSTNLGNSWEPPLQISPSNGEQLPDISYHSNLFQITQGVGNLIYNRSEDFGATYTNHFTLCSYDSGCVATTRQQVSAYNNNVFAGWVDHLFYPEDRMLVRFSRDKGNNWSESNFATQNEQGYLGTSPRIGLGTNDSLAFTVYRHVNSSLINHKLTFRRGVYKYPKVEIEKDSIIVLSGILPNIINEKFEITNSGYSTLQVNEIILPNFANLINSSDSTFFLLPGSSKEIEISLDLTQIQNDTILVKTNASINPNKEIIIFTDIGLSEGNENNSKKIKTFKLSQNYPNPFNPETVINYELGITNFERTTLTIFNVLGKEVRKWILRESDNNQIIWNGTDNFGNPVSSGVYLYQLKVGKLNKTKKMVLLR
ncbi:MAG: T9SS C-terminal target domain-containing protein [Calditrichaeota bacterium]|nr:MAG: T9SS C-terminal target domain-containing protein [Calditrichota bacterium]